MTEDQTNSFHSAISTTNTSAVPPQAELIRLYTMDSPPNMLPPFLEPTVCISKTVKIHADDGGSSDQKEDLPHRTEAFTSVLVSIPGESTSTSATAGNSLSIKRAVQTVRRLKELPSRYSSIFRDGKPSHIMRDFRHAISPFRLELRSWFKREASSPISDGSKPLSRDPLLVVQTPGTPGMTTAAEVIDPDQPNWYRRLKWTVIGKKGPAYVETQMDTCSQHCLMNYDLAKRLSLEIHPLLDGGFSLRGFGGHEERVVKYAYVELECPAIGQERVEATFLLVRAKEVPGLLLGCDFIELYDIDGKMSNLRRRLGPDAHHDVLSTSAGNNISLTIFDDRPDDVKMRDEKIYQQGQRQRIQGIDSVLRNKSWMVSVSPRSIASSRRSLCASEPSLPPSTTISSRTSTFASVFSVGESVASGSTSVASSPVCNDVVKAIRKPMETSAAAEKSFN